MLRSYVVPTTLFLCGLALILCLSARAKAEEVYIPLAAQTGETVPDVGNVVAPITGRYALLKAGEWFEVMCGLNEIDDVSVHSGHVLIRCKRAEK